MWLNAHRRIVAPKSKEVFQHFELRSLFHAWREETEIDIGVFRGRTLGIGAKQNDLVDWHDAFYIRNIVSNNFVHIHPSYHVTVKVIGLSKRRKSMRGKLNSYVVGVSFFPLVIVLIGLGVSRRRVIVDCSIAGGPSSPSMKLIISR